jgi:high-affinity Fe2+/Pb2+ permease
MTFGAMLELLDDAKGMATGAGPEAIQERGLEELFVRLAMVMEAYADGYQDAGGSLEELRSRKMDESYVVQINDLLHRIRD